jgi:hypothetical protein
VIGPGGVVLCNSFQDGFGVAPRDQPVHESVATAALEVLGRKALSKETVGVVGEK